MKKTSTIISLAAAAAVTTGLGVAGAAPAHASGTIWDNVANCESSGNWSTNTGNGFYGGLQFTHSTWIAYGGGAYANNANGATRAEQIAVAQKVLASQGAGAWPVCSVKAGLTSSNGGASTTSGSSTNTGVTSSVASTTSSIRTTSSMRTTSTITSSAASTPRLAAPRRAVRDLAASRRAVRDVAAPRRAVRDLAAPRPVVRDLAASRHTTWHPSSVQARFVTVKAGDTLGLIAQREGTTWQHLWQLNRSRMSNANLIFVGQQLRVA